MGYEISRADVRYVFGSFFFSDLSLTAEELRLTVEIFVLCSLFLIQVGLFAQLLWISSSILPSSMVGSSGYDTSL